MNLGQYIAGERKKLGLSQKDLAARIKKEDGTSISPQYLNGIELGRRHPTSDYLLEQFAMHLNVEPDYLYWLAGQLPPNARDGTHKPPEVVHRAFQAFRRTIQEQ